MLSIVASETENVILILDGNGELLWVNKAFEKLNNLSMEQLIKERGSNISGISNSTKMLDILAECRKSKKQVQYDALNVTNEGKKVWESSTITPIYRDNVLTNFIIIDTDITDIKNAEEEIKRKNKELKQLSIVAEKMNEAVIITDPEGKIEYYNMGLVRNSGYSADEFGEFMNGVDSFFDLSTRVGLEHIYDKFKTNKAPFFYDSTHDTKGGGFMWTTASMSPVYDEDDLLINVIIVYTDIHERKMQQTQLEAKNKEILDSINYAKRLQDAILPQQAFINKCLPQSFVLYQPKDIVAGDFYWLEEIDDVIYFGVGDCTGHGVPGALVSVVCSNALSKAIIEEKLCHPGAILDRCREIIIDRFGRTSSEVKDGMDISLCAYDLNSKKLEWAGANNGLWLRDENQIIQIKPDKQPVGNHPNQKPFTNHEVDLKSGQTLYLFTDGYSDQFGGANGKKFKPKNLRKLILENGNKSLSEQRKVLKDVFFKWKGDLEQIDDVCILGVRL